MSVTTSEVPNTSDLTPTFNRPIPPEPDIQRDAEMLDLYFDPTRTTREIAEHFKLSVIVVVAWFQRPDIAAIIDYVTAASERRARDIARENLPGTINVLQRISLVRNDDKTSRAASSALLTFARGRTLPKSGARAAKRSSESTPPQVATLSNASARSRAADPSPPVDLQRDGPDVQCSRHDQDTDAENDSQRAHLEDVQSAAPESDAPPRISSSLPDSQATPPQRTGPAVASLSSPPLRCAG